MATIASRGATAAAASSARHFTALPTVSGRVNTFCPSLRSNRSRGRSGTYTRTSRVSPRTALVTRWVLSELTRAGPRLRRAAGRGGRALLDDLLRHARVVHLDVGPTIRSDVHVRRGWRGRDGRVADLGAALGDFALLHG